jgi:plasmid replication initiation protein
MAEELIPANTPETLGVTPRYVLQHNAISRSAHTMSATAKKITVMAMALLPPDLSSLTAAFSFTDFSKAIGYGDGGEQYRLFTEAVDECLKTVVSIETGNVIKGKKSWEKFTWFEYAKFNAETGICSMRFSKELADFLKEFKRVYAKINLSDVGRLQSKYGIRIFELAKSYSSLQGKDGNAYNAWYFERSVQEIREMFGIPEKAYPQTRDFRKKVIEEPIKEINKAGVGVEIAAESIKQGRKLAGIRFNCLESQRKTKAKRGRPKKAVAEQQELAYEDPRTVQERTEKELRHLKELYPDEFAGLFEKALSQLPVLGAGVGESFRRSAAEARALDELRAVHGIVK